MGGWRGGGFRSDATAAFEAYDPATGEWSVAAPPAAAAQRGDPRADAWETLPEHGDPVHGVTGAAFVDGLIHMAGAAPRSAAAAAARSTRSTGRMRERELIARGQSRA